MPVKVDRPAWHFRTVREYVVATFDKTALAMRTLQGLLGERTFARALRVYSERFRFRHPTGSDLEGVFEEVAGRPLDDFFVQAFVRDVTVDWRLLAVRNRRPREPSGLSWSGVAWVPWTASDTEERPFTVEVELGRRGDFVGPVEVELLFEDGSTQRRQWDGGDRWVQWRIPADGPVVQVIVDPDGVWALETHRADNYWRAEAEPRLVRRQMWWLADALQLLAMGVLPWS
jgi:hypothetical protein